MRNLRLRRSQSLPSSINRVSVEMSAPTNPDPSLILGAQDLAPFQLVQTYQYFAADDHALPLIAVRGVLDAHTGLLKRYEVQPGPGEYQLPARLVTYALQQVAVEGTATAWRRVRWPGCTPPARPAPAKASATAGSPGSPAASWRWSRWVATTTSRRRCGARPARFGRGCACSRNCRRGRCRRCRRACNWPGSTPPADI